MTAGLSATCCRAAFTYSGLVTVAGFLKNSFLYCLLELVTRAFLSLLEISKGEQLDFLNSSEGEKR